MKHVAASAETIYHPVGTCKIGKESAGGVVDSDLRVHGIKVRPVFSLLIVELSDPAVPQGLRVCDASVFSDQVSGHPQAAVIAVAERFADLLKSQMAV